MVEKLVYAWMCACVGVLFVKMFDSKETKVSEKQSVSIPIEKKKSEIVKKSERVEERSEIVQKNEEVEKGRKEIIEKTEKNSYNYEELPKTNFKKFKAECVEKEFVLPDLSEEEKNEIRKMSQVFWKGSKQILKESTGDFQKDRYIGLLRLYDYIRSWEGYSSVYKKIKIDGGVLKYKYRESYGTCYDGGCYSDETTEYYLCIKKIPAHELEIKFKETLKEREWRLSLKNWNKKIPTQFMYRGELFGADCTMFYTDIELWLYQPFGLADGFCICTECD